MQRIHFAWVLAAAALTPGSLLAATDPITTASPAQAATATPSAPASPAEPASPSAATNASVSPKSATPKLSDILEASGIAVSGYVAASYYHSSGDSTFHELDIEHDSFQLDQAGATIAYQPKEGFGALVNLIAGEDARVVNSYEHGTNGEFNVLQAFVQYARGALTVIGGKFLTLAGAETINPTLNTNFSRSLLYFSEPISHTGLRATYAITDTLNAVVGINNGWNTTSTSYGSKTGELGLAWTPGKTFSWTAQAYVGKDQEYDALRTLFDTIATYNINSSLWVSLNYSHGEQDVRYTTGDYNWDVIAGYVNYAFNDRWRVSLRGELLADHDGFVTGTPQDVEEGTVTVGYSPMKKFELRLEGRYDTSNKPTFQGKSGDIAAFYDHQTGFALQGVYKF
ncbi:MAG TPA: outer membrane beta-barrel protein [Steroidobacteraceae bacterium]|nr:outer membrane beta-barrel protein [Steroidobacteraceae bacterium]